MLWDNPTYISPAKFRQYINKKAAGKYVNKVEQKMVKEITKPKESYALNPMDEIFKGDPLEKAMELRGTEMKAVRTNKSEKRTVKKGAKKFLGKQVKKADSKKKTKKLMK